MVCLRNPWPIDAFIIYTIKDPGQEMQGLPFVRGKFTPRQENLLGSNPPNLPILTLQIGHIHSGLLLPNDAEEGSGGEQAREVTIKDQGEDHDGELRYLDIKIASSVCLTETRIFASLKTSRGGHAWADNAMFNIAPL